jgi:uncharacterized protein (DUF1330 family)
VLRPVEYEYLVRPFWSEGRFMLTRVLHEMVVNKALTVANAKKIIHKKDPRPRLRPFVSIGAVKMEKPELYEQFFLEILNQHGTMWVTDLVLRSHSKLDRDSDQFKKQYVAPALKQKNYLRTFGRTHEAKELVQEIKTVLADVTQHAKGKIDTKFLAEKLNFLGTNFILLDADTRKAIGKELPNLLIEFNTLEIARDMSTFTSLNYAAFSSSFGDLSFDGSFGDSGFDGFGGGDFGGGGGGDSW